jgi:hypothetical protein
MYPVAGKDWTHFLKVSRQDDVYRYPKAVTADRERLSEIVRHPYETRTLWPGCEWISELEYFRRRGRRFYVPDEGGCRAPAGPGAPPGVAPSGNDRSARDWCKGQGRIGYSPSSWLFMHAAPVGSSPKSPVCVQLSLAGPSSDTSTRSPSGPASLPGAITS